MLSSRVLFPTAATALFSSCAVKEDYSVAVDHNNAVSLERRDIVSSWWGDFPKEMERPHPLGSEEGNNRWSTASSVAGAAEGWEYSENQREGENTFRRD